MNESYEVKKDKFDFFFILIQLDKEVRKQTI